MPHRLDRVSLAASLLAPHVSLDWERPRRKGATMISRALIGPFSSVTIQSVDGTGDEKDPCGGLSAWSRATTTLRTDPFPIRFWAYSQITDETAWANLRHIIHQRLIMQAQAHALLSRQPLEELLPGLRVTNPDAARHAVASITGRTVRAGNLAGMIRELYLSRGGAATVNLN